MNKMVCRIIENIEIAKDTFKLTFKWKNPESTQAGQFFNIGVEGFFLPRPISLCSVDDEYVTIIYKAVGEGTKKLSLTSEGQSITVMGPLGKGYPMDDNENVIVLMGGGVGVPPMVELAKRYVAKGARVYAFIGFTDKSSIFGKDLLEKVGAKVNVATDDGSYGTKGTVIDAYEEAIANDDASYDDLRDAQDSNDSVFVCACGPTPMLKAIESKFSRGYISFESRMACGIGACMACVAKDKEEEELYHRICKEGPVFPMRRISY